MSAHQRNGAYLDVEIGKETEKHDGVEAHDVSDDLGEVAFDEEQLRRVDQNGDELNHLDGGQVLLPPEIFMVFGAEGGQQVVRVHDDVNKRVEYAEKSGVTPGSEFDTPPHSDRHDTMVDDMKVGDLVKFLPQYEENGVHEFRELAKVVPPA